MLFSKITKLFEKLETNSKRLKKILYLIDFLQIEENKKDVFLLFDLMTNNFQRKLGKKNISISLKTIFNVISKISNFSKLEIEKKFNDLGDIGEVSSFFLEKKKQKSFITKNLTFEKLIQSILKISNTSGTNSNKIKEELIFELFSQCEKPLDVKFLSRILIFNFRIGVNEGTIKEVITNYYFPKIFKIHFYCENCKKFNLNLENCFNCEKKINLKQGKIKNYNYIGNFDYKDLNFIKNLKSNDILEHENFREVYNFFLEVVEKKYNLLNSFEEFFLEVEKNFLNIEKFEIKLLTPLKSMLAQSSLNVKEAFEVVKKPSLLDYKYDGVRLQIHNKNGIVKLFTRNLEDITSQFPEIVNFIKDNFSDVSFILDSECVGIDYENFSYVPFQIFSRRILSKDIEKVSHIKSCVKSFDILYLNGETLLEKPYKNRREILENLFLNKEIINNINFDTKLLTK